LKHPAGFQWLIQTLDSNENPLKMKKKQNWSHWKIQIEVRTGQLDFSNNPNWNQGEKRGLKRSGLIMKAWKCLKLQGAWEFVHDLHFDAHCTALVCLKLGYPIPLVNYYFAHKIAIEGMPWYTPFSDIPKFHYAHTSP
jgi:hypothetical protein